MKTGKGFLKLKGLAAVGAFGVAGLVGGGQARAASTALPLNVTRGAVVWNGVDNNSRFPSSGTVTTTNGDVYPSKVDGYGISDAALDDGASGSFGDAFDNALILSVNGTLFTNPDTTVDLTGDTVTSDTVAIIPGINAEVRYNFFPGRPVVRGLFSLTNTSGAAITLDATILGDFGSDSNTAVRATSNGDTTIETSDFWYMTDDQGGGKGTAQVNPRKVNAPNGNGDPRITTTRYGAGAAVIPFNALTPGTAGPAVATTGLRYPVTIAAGATARIMVFMELSDPTANEAAAVAAAADFESLAAAQAAGLLTGISTAEQAQIVNYVQPGGNPPPAEGPTNLPTATPAGLAALFAALGGLGFLELRRRRKLGQA